MDIRFRLIVFSVFVIAIELIVLKGPLEANTAPPAKADWTLAFYLAGENSLEREQVRNLKEILQAADKLHHVNIVVFFDRDERFEHESAITSWKGTRVFHVTPPYKTVTQRPIDIQLPAAIQAERFNRLIMDRLEKPDDHRRITAAYKRVRDRFILQPTAPRQRQEVMRLLTEKAEYLLPLRGQTMVNLPATDKKTQRQFFCFLQDNYPAQKYGLFMVGHGSGWYEKETATVPSEDPRGSDSTEYYRSLKSTEIADASRWLHFDFIAMDSCLMADIETLWTLKNSADFLILNQIETPSRGLNYSELLEELAARVDRTPRQWAMAVADAYARSYKHTPYPISASVFDTRRIKDLVGQWQLYWSDKNNQLLLSGKKPHPTAVPTFSALHDAMVDMTDLCRTLGLNVFDASISGNQGAIIYAYRQSTETKGLSIYLPSNQQVYRNTIDPYRSTLLSKQFADGWVATVDALFSQ